MEKLFYNTQYIDYYMQENNISKEEFCKLCNISEDILNNIYNHKSMILDKWLFRLLDVLNITADTFFFKEKFYREKPNK